MTIARCTSFVLSFCIALSLVFPGCGRSPEDGVLLDFEKEADLDHLFWKCKTWFELSSEGAPQGKQWLKAELPPGDFPGVRFIDLPPNWRGYGGLSFVAWSPDKEGARLHLRIDDHRAGKNYEERFNQIFTLAEKPKRYCASINAAPVGLPGRKLKLGSIDRVMVFLYNQKEPTTLFLDDLRLLKDCDNPPD